ncbi:MAG: 16S rRNA processing protein RimM [Candidatus Omnitrophica bacterium]|nr:16S rRNA processing protein RimM [Candidatus Omnitrophota bacterium]
MRKRRPPVRQDRIYLGRIVKPHGLRGEVKFHPFGCDPWILEDLQKIQLESPNRELDVEYVRGTVKAPIVKFQTVDDRDGSESLVGGVVWIQESILPELAGEEFYESDILFSRVVTVSGKELGQIQEIVETGACDVLVVRNENGEEELLPASREVVKEIRKTEGLVIVEPPVYEETKNAD